MPSEQALFLAAGGLTVVVAACVDVLMSEFRAPDMRSSSKVYVGALSGAAFMAILCWTGVVPVVTGLAFVLPWAVAQVASAGAHGVDTVRDRVKRASLATACGALGVMVSLRL